MHGSHTHGRGTDEKGTDGGRHDRLARRRGDGVAGRCRLAIRDRRSRVRAGDVGRPDLRRLGGELDRPRLGRVQGARDRRRQQDPGQATHDVGVVRRDDPGLLPRARQEPAAVRRLGLGRSDPRADPGPERRVAGQYGGAGTGFRFVLRGITRTVNARWHDMETPPTSSRQAGGCVGRWLVVLLVVGAATGVTIAVAQEPSDAPAPPAPTPTARAGPSAASRAALGSAAPAG